MKSIWTAIAAMAAIIALQILLSFVFTHHTGEIFSKVSCTVLFYYYVCKMIRKKRAAAH